MGLSSDLISQFVKITNDKADTKKNTTVYGTIVKENDIVYVQIDGSEGRLTPISPTTTDVENGDRVSVSIVNHSAVITGNLSSPSARTHTVQDVDRRVVDNTKSIAQFGEIVADKVSTKDLEAETARITLLEAANVTITGKLTAVEADIGTLTADNVTINDTLKATNIIVTNLTADVGSFKELTTGTLVALEASIEELDAKKLSAESADIKYANIDFTNIGSAAMQHFYAQSGLIKDVTVGDQTITGHLQGVVISGDLIEANTLKAEKLVIKGPDGLYYRINTNGTVTETEQTDQNSLNGSIIRAKSIVASKIDVKDLVAFGATIGGFHISDNSIYSGVKSTISNTTRGIYLDNDGQIAFGDSSNFLKFYKDSSGKYKLAISADELIFSDSGTDVSTVISNAQTTANAADTKAGNAQKAFDNLQVGGRNLFKGYGEEEIVLPNYQNTGSFKQFRNCYTFDPASTVGETYTVSFYAKSPNGSTTISVYNSNENNRYLSFSKQLDGTLGNAWQYYTYTFTNKDRGSSYDASASNKLEIYAPSKMGVVVKKIKFEKGNKATDWTPAPEDVADDISTAKTTADGVKTDLANNYTKKTLPDTRSDNQNPGWYITNYPRQIITEFKLTTAIGLTGEMFCTLTTTVPWANDSGGYPKQVAKVGNKEYWRVGTSDTAWGAWNDAIGKAEAAAKTATNYMKFESGKGLTIGDMTANTLGRNVLIDADSVDIRNGSTVLSTYSDSLIRLGKSTSRNVLIDSDSFDIRNGDTVLASYSDNGIQLGMNSPLSVIDLCGGTGSITSSSLLDGSDWWRLDIHSQNSIGLHSGIGELTASNYYESGYGDWAQTMIRATATTPWISDPNVAGLDRKTHGSISILSESQFHRYAGGEWNKQYIEMNAADGIVLCQDSVPEGGDTQIAAIRIKASSNSNPVTPPSITLDARNTDVTGDIRVDGNILMTRNGYTIYGKRTDGTYTECFTPCGTSNLMSIGRGNYNAKSGTTNLYGNDVQIGCAAAGSILYKPYYRKSESITNVTFQGAGFVTNSKQDIYFSIPLSKPVIGSPTVLLSSGTGFRLRQNGKGTHGSASSAVSPSSYTATLGASGNYILVKASFTNVTNAVDDESIGIEWNGTISFK